MAVFRAFGGFLAFLIVATIVAWAYVLCAIGLPFGPKEGLNTTYWAIVTAVSTVTPSLVLYSVAMMLFTHDSGRIVATIDVVFWVISLIATIVGAVFLLITWLACEFSYVCDSLIPWGDSSAPGVAVYRGRFIGIFIIHWVMLGVSAVGIAVSYFLYRFSRAHILAKAEMYTKERASSSEESSSPVGGCGRYRRHY